MKIDFDNINTYPIEIMRYALENEFEDYNKTDFDVPVPEFFYDILDKYDFIVYHCTRTVNINSFKRNGILIPEDKKLSAAITILTLHLCLPEIRSEAFFLLRPSSPSP